MTKRLPTFISYITDVNVNNDKLEEQTAIAEIGTTSTQMTTTLNSTLSRGNLNPNVNFNPIVTKSNSIFEMAIGDEELSNKFGSNIDDKSILSKDKSWNSGHYCPYCHDESLQIPIKHESCDTKMIEKEMIEEYKLSESVAEMVKKYEQKSRLENN
ncbi:unnamed protein product [Cercopithifilaria johnstoni]|uniref:Uncharacterized protein n=1 Tax=Cercopithifilaria johnstoni TaxID=2874296 RepID=A0A8J2MGP4_9BILA|nr:unnamed protein product [Cercopithifilaria johnstoni]